LRNFTLIDFSLLGQEINREAFLQNSIPFVLFICEDALNYARLPVPFAACRPPGFPPWKKYHRSCSDLCFWRCFSIVNILKKREYLGHTVNFKTRKHFKDKKSHYVDESEWTIFENTHEAIIDQETFDNVQRIRGNVRRYPDGWGETHPLTGLMYCADCGGKMYIHRTNNGKRIPQYTCSRYSKVPVGTPHPAPHQRRRGDDTDCRYAPRHRGVFQE
jgi:hypothetical protein